ncbi:MAG TPA: winged helix-turn-helix domain-containing protein [Candidatus Saccharimonadia bacterium]|nr:winged helix-turn-helix domain-containing protein [Candidatus Saccharimonadia bacterium]
MNANVQSLRRTPELRYARIAGRFIDVSANRVRRDGAEIRLTPKAMGVLRELLLRPEQVVKRDDLLGIVWRDGFPTDDVLTHAITELRRALEDDPRAPRLIETIPRVGYRLLGAVELLDAPPAILATPAPAIEPVVPAAMPKDAIPQRAAHQAPPQLTVAIAFVLLLGSIALLWWNLREPGVAPTAVVPAAPAAAAAPPAPLFTDLRAVTADPAREQFPSLSPDGSSVAYVRNAAGDQGGIVLRSLDAGSTARPLSEPPAGMRDDFPVWSPDGTRIAFLRWSDSACEIHVIPALGGPSHEVGPCRMRILDYLEWTPDGEGLLICRALEGASGMSPAKGVIHRLDLETGTLVRMPYTASGTDADIQARVSPDGRTLAFRRGGAPYSDIYLVPYGGGEPRRLTNLRARMRGYAWYPDNAALLVSSDHAGRQSLYRVDVATGAIAALAIDDAEFPDIARRAPLVVFQKENQLNQLAEIVLADPEAKPRFLAPATRSDSMPAYSPDGRRVAFLSARSGDPQLWIYDAATEAAHPVTHYADVELESPRWSPDGKRILHVVRGGGRSRLAAVEVESRRVTVLSRPDENVRFGSYSHDGGTIYFSSDRGGAWQPWRMPAGGGESERLADVDAIDPVDPLGDGYIYASQENARGLFRLDLATRRYERVAPNVGYWNRFAWTVRADGLYVVDSADNEMGATLFRSPLEARGEAAGAWSGFPMDKVLMLPMMFASYDVSLSPDAKRLVLSVTTRDETDLMAADLSLAQPLSQTRD